MTSGCHMEAKLVFNSWGLICLLYIFKFRYFIE